MDKLSQTNKQRNKFDIKTVEAFFTIKTNFNSISCEEFYDKILKKKHY